MERLVEEIRARELDTVSSQERRDDYAKAKRWMEIGFEEMKRVMIDALGQRDDALRDMAALREDNARLRAALKWIADQEDLTFAESTLAERIISTAREALSPSPAQRET